jgi:CRISPR-associated endonuclease Csn1
MKSFISKQYNREIPLTLPALKNLLFAFDIGTNSIGWCVLGLDEHGDPDRIVDMGTRIYSDGREPKSKASLAVARREARAASRMRDRYKRRRTATLRTLIEFGLMPAEKAAQEALLRETGDRKEESGDPSANPYALRALALDEKLPPAYLGRALFHLGQRRGFKSNRKTDRRDNDQGKIAQGIADLKGAMHDASARTYGEWLAMRREKGEVVRLRDGSDVFGEEGYAYYPERSLLEAEFHAIWDAQSVHHPQLLTEERRAYLFRVMFYQHPLKKPKVGKCAFNPLEERMAKAHPLFQEFRLYKEVNELELVLPDLSHQKLSLDQRDALIHHLRSKKEVAFTALRRTLKLTPDISFNKESDSRKKLKGDEVHAVMADKKRFGPQWAAFDRDEQWQIITRLKEEEDPLALYEWLWESYQIEGEQAQAIANAPLPDGHGRLGETALSSMLDELKNTIIDGFVIVEAQAAQNCGYDHSRLGFESDEGEPFLPPYQEILERHIPPGSGNPDDLYDLYKGRITNPTVHIGLNQLRRLVNTLIKRHGKPRFMAVELARDLQLSDKQKTELNKTIRKNTQAAEARGEKLLEMKQYNNGYNRLLLKLWEELNLDSPENRLCIYSGKVIGCKMLFSGEVDIDHILPWSRTLDDSQANKILCLKSANRQKRNRAPAEVAEWQDDYDEILARAARLPKNKRWRFATDAMEKFEQDGGFLARQLTDTQYLSRMAREYLECLYPYEEPDEYGELKRRRHVLVSPGRLTEMLRRNWQLNSLLPDSNLGEMAQAKNRLDHRHHAIDAAVVGVTTRSLLNRISQAAGRMEESDLENLVNKMVAQTPPWKTFREDLQKAVGSIIVSHKPDHGTVTRTGLKDGKGKTAGKLHNETAYGLGKDRDGKPVAVRRKPFMSLQLKDLPDIRDEHLRAELYSALDGINDKKALQEALIKFRKEHKTFRGIRRVRMAETLSLIPIKDKNGKAYKGYKGDANYRFDVWETLDNKWHSEVVSMFDIHQAGWTSRFHQENPTARRVLSLKQNDMVAYEHPIDGYTIGRVVKFAQSGSIYFADHKEGGSLKARNSDSADPFKYFQKTAGALQKAKCRQVRIDESGRIFDPGPQDRASRQNMKKSISK